MKSRTQRYINILQDTVQIYNQTVHRSLGEAPASISKDNEGESRLKQYLLRHAKDKTKKKGKNKIKRPYKLEIGQTVCLSHVRGLFDREYSQKWTGEIFLKSRRVSKERASPCTGSNPGMRKK